MSKQVKQKSTCIICKIILSNNLTKVTENPKYLKYRDMVCNKCFDQYYPKTNLDQEEFQ